MVRCDGVLNVLRLFNHDDDDDDYNYNMHYNCDSDDDKIMNRSHNSGRNVQQCQ